MQLFLMPIRENKCLSEALVGTIFSNVTTLLNVNKTLLKEFSDTAAKDKGDSIGICFIHLVHTMRLRLPMPISPPTYAVALGGLSENVLYLLQQPGPRPPNLPAANERQREVSDICTGTSVWTLI